MRAAAPSVVLATTAVDAGGKTQIFGGGEGWSTAAPTPSFSSFEKDADGVQRRLLYSESGPQGVPDRRRREVRRPRDRARRRRARDWIDFEGGPETFQHLSFVDVEQGNFDPADVRGKIVVVGATATALQDIRETSTTNQRAMAGPEVHANAITTALDGYPLRAPRTGSTSCVSSRSACSARSIAIRLRMLFAIPLAILAHRRARSSAPSSPSRPA